MNLEIERKWLITELPQGADLSNALQLEQGYFAVEYEPQIRIRKTDDEFELTVKRKRSELERDECNVPLSQEQYELLLPMTVDAYLSKTRYLIHFKELTIELDVYQDKLKGLMVAEVEFESVKQANAFEPPNWFGPDISNDHRYSNRKLAASGLIPQFDEK